MPRKIYNSSKYIDLFMIVIRKNVFFFPCLPKWAFFKYQLSLFQKRKNSRLYKKNHVNIEYKKSDSNGIVSIQIRKEKQAISEISDNKKRKQE
jgi:hypothetical protein